MATFLISATPAEFEQTPTTRLMRVALRQSGALGSTHREASSVAELESIMADCAETIAAKFGGSFVISERIATGRAPSGYRARAGFQVQVDRDAGDACAPGFGASALERVRGLLAPALERARGFQTPPAGGEISA